MGWLGQTEIAHDMRVAYEPTGPSHRAFERRLDVAGAALVKVNPRQARRFAEATGKLAKIDRMDAAMLARMGALLEFEARPVGSPSSTISRICTWPPPSAGQEPHCGQKHGKKPDLGRPQATQHRAAQADRASDDRDRKGDHADH
ncbi:hypothetical protein [Rhizobium gallicum]|uniref:hypothetical protein n=1 Tax=Rhizobium gallicum TaxID=56730 RepID=UPI003B8A632F